MDRFLNRINIIDGSFMVHRSLKQDAIFELKNSQGEGTGAVFSVLRMLNKELRICGDYYPIVCFDEGLDPRRVATDPHYKHADERAEKSKMVLVEDNPDDRYLMEYRHQRNILMELLISFGVPCLKFPSVEGDDLMYVLSKISHESIVLTDDKDLLQLLSDRTCVRRPMKEVTWTLQDFLDENNFSEIYDFTMAKAITGDGSDNIVGSCKGVGGGTAVGLIKIIKQFYKVSRGSDGKITYEADWSGYPRDMDALKYVCNQLDISPRKAYLNLDIRRFETNMELVDLERVDLPDRVMNSIETVLRTCRDRVNYFEAMKILGRLEIREFPADEFMAAVSSRIDNLLIKE